MSNLTYENIAPFSFFTARTLCRRIIFHGDSRLSAATINFHYSKKKEREKKELLPTRSCVRRIYFSTSFFFSRKRKICIFRATEKIDASPFSLSRVKWILFHLSKICPSFFFYSGFVISNRSVTLDKLPSFSQSALLRSIVNLYMRNMRDHVLRKRGGVSLSWPDTEKERDIKIAEMISLP